MRTVIPRLSLSLQTRSFYSNERNNRRKEMDVARLLAPVFTAHTVATGPRNCFSSFIFFFQHDGRNPYTVPKCYLYTLFYRMAVRKDRATNWRGPDACGALVLCSTSPRARYTANRRRRRRRR